MSPQDKVAGQKSYFVISVFCSFRFEKTRANNHEPGKYFSSTKRKRHGLIFI